MSSWWWFPDICSKILFYDNIKMCVYVRVCMYIYVYVYVCMYVCRSIVQKVPTLTKKEEHSWTFLSWQHTATSYKTRKTHSEFSSFIKGGKDTSWIWTWMQCPFPRMVTITPRVPMFVYVCVCTHVYVSMCVHMYVCMYVCVYMCVCLLFNGTSTFLGYLMPNPSF